MYNNVNAAPWANVPPLPSYTAPSYSYGYVAPTRGNDTFVLIVVLFILLIIVGTTIVPTC